MFIDEAFTYKYYNNIIAVSHEICERLTKRNIGKGRIIVIENGIDPSLYDDETYEGNNHEPLPIDKSKRVFAVIGRLFPDKGHRFFLQAFSHVVQNNSLNIALLIGDGPSEEDIKIQIKDLKLENNVFLCGVRKDMKYIYNNVDYIVMPSLTEGLPYVLLEAMLYKVPILATDVGGISSLVKNDVTGYLVPPGDVESLKNDMNKMLNNPEKIKTMAENAYNLVKEEYSARRMVDQIGHLYDTMINDRLDRHA
jgi:glycosyltransferase involved in cell wall biosynthesis